MKIKFLTLIQALMIGALLVNCGSDPEPETTAGTGTSSGGGTGTNPGSENVADKNFLETTGTQFVNSFNKADFTNFEPIRRVLEEKRYDSEGLKHFEDVYESLKRVVSSSTYYSYYRTTLIASQFYGNYYVANNKWYYQESTSGCQFRFPDANGQEVVATVKTSGSTKTVYLYDERDHHYSYTNSGYTYSEETNSIYAAIPERIEVLVTQGGTKIVESVTNINLSNVVEGEKYDLSRNSFDVNTKTTIKGKYVVNVSQAKYTANNGANVSFTISSGGTTLVTGTASAKGQATNEELKSLRDINATLDILGRVQLKATCDDGIALSNYMDDARSYRYEESRYKSIIDQINRLYTVNMYYNGNSTLKATAMLEPFEEQYQAYSWNPTTGPQYTLQSRWECKPIIKFTSDQSSYALEEYFSESRFKSVVDDFKSLVESVARNFTDERIDW